MPSGELTAKVARQLSKEYKPRGFDVFFDHGQQDIDCSEKLGEIVSWFGDHCDRSTRLAVLDIAVVCHKTNKVVALIEIEETSGSPKVIIGDVMATLLGEHITFRGNRGSQEEKEPPDLKVGNWTALIVLVKDENQEPSVRMKYLEKNLKRLKQHLPTANSLIGRFVVLPFTGISDLKIKLSTEIEKSIRSGCFSVTI